MIRKFQVAGFVFASLTIATVALAQQGGRGGGDGGSEGGDNSVIALRLYDHEQARLTRAIAPRRAGADCTTRLCNEPPQRRPPLRAELEESGNCGENLVPARDRNGRPIRRICRTY